MLAFAGSFIFGLRGGNRERPLVPDTVATPQPRIVNDARARVEVYNGAGKPGLAKHVTAQLRDAGFDVVQFGNARTLRATSEVIDRVGKPEIAKSIGEALGITQVTTAVDTTRYVDATVLLGSDWVRRDSTKN